MRTKQLWVATATLVSDISLKTFDDGGRVINARVIVDEYEGGKQVPQAFPVRYRISPAFPDSSLNFLLKHCRKGASVWVSGRVRTEHYTDRDGVDRVSTFILATDLTYLAANPAEAREARASEDDDQPGADPSPPPAPPAQEPRAQAHPPAARPAPPAPTMGSSGVPFDDPSRW